MKTLLPHARLLGRTLRAVLCVVFAFSLFIEAFSHSAHARSPDVTAQTLSLGVPGGNHSAPNPSLTADCAAHGCWSLQPAPSHVVADVGKPLHIRVAPSADHAAEVPVSERPPRG